MRTAHETKMKKSKLARAQHDLTCALADEDYASAARHKLIIEQVGKVCLHSHHLASLDLSCAWWVQEKVVGGAETHVCVTKPLCYWLNCAGGKSLEARQRLAASCHHNLPRSLVARVQCLEHL